MHKHIFFKLSFLFLLLLTMAACSLDAEDNGEASLEPGEFWARDLRTNKWYKVSAQKLYEGSRCIIWVERGLNVSTAQAEQVAAEYSTNIYSKIIGTFGDVLDVDDNGKVILLLMDIIDGGSNNSYTAGYFDSTQMVKTTSDKPSNEADMLYIDAKQSKVCSPGFYSTIAHELAHLINYSQKKCRLEPQQIPGLTKVLPLQQSICMPSTLMTEFSIKH